MDDKSKQALQDMIDALTSFQEALTRLEEREYLKLGDFTTEKRAVEWHEISYLKGMLRRYLEGER